MKLLNLKASRLFSIDSAALNLDHQGLVLVTGKNGSGKSTLANKSIIWTLFGSTAGGTRGDEVINRHIDLGTAYGEVTFESHEGEVYCVYRARPTKLTLLKQNTVDDKWTDISAKTQADTQLMINDLLGRNLQSFLQTDFFGQGRDRSFLALTSAQQTEVLERIFPINDLNTWSALAKEEKKHIDNVTSNFESSVTYHNGQLSSMLQILGHLTSQRRAYELKKQERIDLMNEELKSVTEHNENIQTEVNYIKGKLAQEETLERLQEQLAAMEQNGETILNQLKKEEDDLVQAKIKQERLREQENNLLDRIHPVPDEACPTCGSEISTEMHEQILAVQHHLKGELHTTRAKLKEQDARVATLTTQTDWSNQNRQLKTTAIASVKTRIEYVKEKQQRLKELSSEIKDEEVVRARLIELEAEDNPYEAERDRTNVTVCYLRESITTCEEMLAQTQMEANHLHFWQNAFGKDFKYFLLERACPFLESRTAYHLDALENSQLKVKFSIVKENKAGEEKICFNTHVHSEEGGDGFDSLSGGEQAMSSFAVGMALADLAETQVKGNSHFLILDEPFMSLDERNCEALVNYLNNELSSKRETILLISNEENLKSLIANRIHVEKKEGITHAI